MNEYAAKTGSTGKVRILLADDHPLIRFALKGILAIQDDLEIVGEVDNGEDAVNVAIQIVPDIVIMDITMPKMNGLEATRQIKKRCPSIAVLALTIHSDSEHILGIFEAGASGYLTKSAFGDEILSAIKGIMAGEMVISPDILQEVLQHTLSSAGSSLPIGKAEKLTPREQEILRLAAKGMSNKDIAGNLDISVPTVKVHLVHIFSKLQVASRTEALITAVRLGLIDVKEFME